MDTVPTSRASLSVSERRRLPADKRQWTNAQRVAQGLAPRQHASKRGPRPTDQPRKLEPSKFSTTPEHRLREQVTEMIGRGNRTMERWRGGER